ncbi:hypothetical protein VI817_001618 [Penicillium citrinum]|uniref:DAGKc domain-containing protein n=1 Tax=Penicillium hetheringtonii TaxID=911720 RepID=A0AAD6E514_9EURO|nr:hypothetical protein N7450_001648 [Penicillium hetheringtonii]KAK5807360.1 hypothetical protein VI817_001618 [Penicillium citrinum]
MSADNELRADISSVEGSTFKWSIDNEEDQVELNDIICVVPKESGHRVLFLKHENTNGDISTQLKYVDISSIPPSLTPFWTDIPAYLQGPEPIQVVISTRSGTGAARTIFTTLVKPFLEDLNLNYSIYETKSAQTITELSQSNFLPYASTSTNSTPQTILLLSGDGGLVDILDVFYRNEKKINVEPNIALIPCGTGNAMASSIGLRSGPASGLKTLLRGRSRKLPTFTVKLSAGSQLVVNEGNDRVPINADAEADTNANANADETTHTMYGAVVASWGLHAALVADSDTTKYREFGSERFQMAAKELLHPSDGSDSHRFRGKITFIPVPGSSTTATATATSIGVGNIRRIPEEEHMYVLTTMVPRLEKDFVISPSSEVLSGDLRLLRFGPLSPDDAMRLMTLAYQGGGHVKEKGVLYEEVQMVRIEFDEEEERWRRVCVDGKIVAVEKGGWMEIRKGGSVLNIVS